MTPDWLDLNLTWFVLISVLVTGYALLDGFDLGVGALYLFLKGDQHRQMLLRSIGPVWDGNEVWLITAGGALFAAFPIAYATVFSGFYMAMILLLFALILRAISIEVRNLQATHRWRGFWDRCFILGSTLAALLLGVALGNIVRGIPLDERHEFAGTFTGLLNPYALLLGLTTLLLFGVHGAAYGMLKTDGELKTTLRKFGFRIGIVGIACLILAIAIATVGIPHVNERVRGAPWLLLLPVLTLVCMANALHKVNRDSARGAFYSTSAVIVLVIAQVAAGVYPNIVISQPNPTNSITIYNGASSPRTLSIMLVIALIGMPLVLAYTIIVYRAFKGKVQPGEPGY